MSEQDPKLVAKLATKLSKLGTEIGALAKDGTNQHSRYQYISNEQMVTAIRQEAGKHKVKIIPSVANFTERDFQNANGKMVTRSSVNMLFKIIDMETGYYEVHQFSGAEQDTGGKSLQQAMTQCTKYFYFKLFDVTSQEEVDGDSKTEESATPQAPDNRPWLNKGTMEWQGAIEFLQGDGTIERIKQKYKINKKDEEQLMKEVMS